MSSSPVISDDHALSLQSSLCNVVDHRESTLGSSTCIQSKLYSSKRGPGRPRKDIPLLKTPQKRKIVKESQIFHDRVGSSIALVPSSSESSNTGFSEEKNIPNVESPYSVEKNPGRVCCLCNLSERSVLGQGDFLKWDIDCSTCMAPKICNRDEKQVPDESCKGPPQSVNSQMRRQKNNYRNKSSSSECLNELDQVGRVEATPLQMLVDGGHIYMHRMCLWWSQGISGKTLELKSNIESVVTKSLTRKCSFCGQYGASVVCKMNCTNVFHLPCAAAAGCFLLMENFIVFCRDHVKQVPIVCSDLNLACRHCSKIDEISMMVMCATCGDHYHSTCVGLVNKPDTRAGWNCPQCSKCLICRECEGIEGRSIKCEQCQRLYHISCLRPAVSSLPKYGWKCNRCRVCTDCGSRTPGGGTSSRWHCHYTICDSCYQQRNKGFSCPICHKAYRATAHKEMVKCSLCHRFVHSLCDEDADLNVYHKKKENNPDYDYVCPQCKRTPNGEKLQALSNQTRCPWQSNALDIFTLTTHESIFKEVEYENYEKYSDDYAISDPIRMSKKKIIFKDFQRSRNGKIVMQKNSVLSHLSGKRNVRAKSRHFLPPSTNFGLPGDKEISRISDDGLSTEKKMLLCSAKDKFILSQDICVMCGSVGLDKESHLIACAQCGQCYHPYCVNIKLSKVVLQRGWRCLDCTVCEGCGQRNDEARLILCDECDLSFHIYCMSPPLDTVPHGNWKCKWCAACQKCGRYAGIHSQNHSGFLECGPCASQVTCCVCNQQYNEKELIIQCRNCKRWLHCECDSIKSEEEAQMYDKLEYHCTLCRPKGRPLSYLLTQKTNSNGNKSPKINSNIPLFWSKSTLGVEVNGTASAANDPSEQIEVTFWIDGICMSDKGANMIKSLSTEIKRKRKIKAAGDCQTKESGIIAAIESVVAGSNLNIESGDGELSKKKDGNYKDGMVWIGADNSPPQGFSISTNDEGVSILRRKRQRNLQKLGIGGFNVRNRTFKKVNEEPSITNLNSLDFKKKKKFLRKKVKSKLNEAYPTYLQEAFFGKTLLDMKSKNLTVFESDTSDGPNESRQTVCAKKQNEPVNTLKSLPNKVVKTSEKTTDKLCIETNVFGANTQENENDFKEVNYEENLAHRGDYDQKNEEILIQDVKMISLSSPVIKNHSIEESLGAPFLSEISSTTSSVSDRQVLLEHTNAIGTQTLQQEPSSKSDLQLNCKADFSTSTKKLNAQGDNPSISEDELLQSCSPQKRTCGDVSHVIQQLQPTQQNNHRASQILNTDIVSMDLQLPQTVQSVETSLINDKAMKLPILQEGFTQQKSGGINDAAINVYFTPTAPEETAEAVVAGTQKTAEKMRRDEDLGDMATISAVLYANTQHPELKQIYPNWNDRCKQILKRWRSLSTEKKAPFLQHAKDNRSALRMRRSQQDQERICLNQKTLKEQEQERIWKQHQAKAKEAQTNAYTNRGMIYDVNICPEGGTIDKHHAMYNNDLIPEAPVQTFAAEEIYNANLPTIPVQDSTILIEQSNVLEKDNNPPENKQLRTLLLKQQGLASSWVLDPVPNRSNIFQQSYEFQSGMQQNAQKANLYQCTDSRAQITISTLKNAAMLQSLENMPQESLVTENKSTLKCRREKISDNGDADMEKLDPDENVGFGDILGGLGDGNDDDLLKSLTAEIGDDFNILEYADPELDELASSQNLLNKLDFDYNDRNS